MDQVIADALAELQEKNTFHSLLQAVEQEKKRKAHLQDIIIRSRHEISYIRYNPTVLLSYAAMHYMFINTELMCCREEETRLKTKALQRQLVDVRKEKTITLQVISNYRLHV